MMNINIGWRVDANPPASKLPSNPTFNPTGLDIVLRGFAAAQINWLVGF